jgi:glutamate/tyrosine decarboxylase-like PLP-dependent enzyme
MNATDPIQERLFRELDEREAFEIAHAHGMAYLDGLAERNVFPTDEAIADLSTFDEDLPTGPTAATSVIETLARYGGPATTTQLGGRYFGFVTGSATPAGLAAKSLATYWDQNSAMKVMSPLTARLEAVVEKWLAQIFRLPADTAVGFVSGTALANFGGLAAGRYRLLERLGWDVNVDGLFDAPRLRIVTGEHAHSAVHRAIAMLGFGDAIVERVPVDEQGRLIAAELPPLDDRCLVILQAGNVDSGSFDPLAEVCSAAREAGAWVHVDGAFGLWAAAAPELAHLTRGLALADSWATDGHKTLNTPYDSGVVMCRDRDALASAFRASGSYLVVSEEREGLLFTPDMSRRSRVIEFWATLKSLGMTGLSELVTGLHHRAGQFGVEIALKPGFEVLNDVVFNQVLVACENDELTADTLQRVQELRECWVGGSTWQGRTVIRVSVSSWATTEQDVTRSVDSFGAALADVLARPA